MTDDRTITVTPGDDQPGQHHTDPTGTIAHTGPVAGCTLPGCEQTPDTEQQARRKHLADLVLRMRRGELHPQGRDILAAVIKDELAYGDQAREQLAAARALRFGAHDIEVCNQQRAAHTGLREALRSAFGQDNSVSDDDLFECVRQQAADLTRARRGEAEAVRAREAAEADATQARARVAELEARDTPTWRQRAERAEATLSESETVGHKLLQRAEFAEEQLTAAVKRADLAERIKRTAAADAAAAIQRAIAAEGRAAKAEVVIERMKRTNRMVNRGARDADERAERAEATLTAVRAIKKAPGRSPDNRYANAQDDGWDQAIDAVRAALGDPQPATEPEACDAYQPPTTAADSGLCASCGMYDHKHTAAAEPERPTVSVIDVLATALVAAGRRILRGETP